LDVFAVRATRRPQCPDSSKLEGVTPEPHIDDAQAQAETAAALGRAAGIMARLRAPNGCPWDREQSFDTIKRHTLEEVYEVFDAIERRAWTELKDELGDLLLQVLFYAQMASEAGYFSLRDVAEGLIAKLIRRHPHVFGDVVASDADAVLRNWEQIKREEKRSQAAGEAGSMFEDIPRSMPAMLEATKLGSRAAKVGFDWPEVEGLFDKLAEETAELRAELAENSAGTERSNERIEDELGDLLFTTVHLARHLHVDPESALRGSNAKFRRRFAAMEHEAGSGAALAALPAEEMERLWSRVKKNSEQIAPEGSSEERC
jgi:XTP/dITP diphosphohydrolase/ATP diphosphatase